MFKSATLFFFFSLILVTFANAQSFPLKPDAKLTPGSLCLDSGKKIYPERIQVCSRDVDSDIRQLVIADYTEKYRFEHNNNSFKLDHFIPLCMGGSNTIENLWVQHVSLYSVTDTLEALLCKFMEQGQLKQKDAIYIIKKMKNDIKNVPNTTKEMVQFLR